MPVEKQRIAPMAFLEELVDPFRIRAKQKGLDFSLRSEGTIPRYIYCDPLRLRQIISNLLGNAIKFTNHGTVGLQVTGQGIPSGVELEFAVTDTGPGMDKNQQKALFQPFSQVDSSSRRQFGGAGLGLAISRRLAELMDGELSVESEPDAGSRFLLRLRLSRDECLWDQPEQESKEDSVSLPSTPGRIVLGRVPEKKREILVVEDTEDIQVLLKRQLEGMGAQVMQARNGKEALDMVESRITGGRDGRFDVVLMDIQMPVMDGYEAVKRLRAAGYSGRIVALTAHAMEGEEQRCLAAGMDGYLAKPVDRVALRSAIGLSGEKKS